MDGGSKEYRELLQLAEPDQKWEWHHQAVAWTHVPSLEPHLKPRPSQPGHPGWATNRNLL